MPLYEFECAMGHRFEKLFPISKLEEVKKNGIPCEGGYQSPQGTAHFVGEEFGNGRAYLVPSRVANIQIGQPTIVFKDPRTGVAQIATSRYDSPPPGFIKEEIRGSIERTKFENEQNKLASFEDEVYNTNREMERELLRKSIIDDTNANASIDAAQSDNPSATEHLMKRAIEHIRNKPKLRKKRKTEFRLDVNHLDKSNLK
jgi:hypothetical protein